MSDQRGGNAFNRDPQRTAMIERVDTAILGGMGAIDGSGDALRTNFLPQTFHEAMEMAKLMSAGTFVPTRLRNKPGDCLAVVMQATRWGMDPFAVAQKIYFVNNDGIPGYEAQLIVAVINTSGVLKERLHVEWEGEGETLKCKVTGQRRDDQRAKVIEQEIRTITTKNSPLWKQSPRQQLAYFTQRLWARLYAPEVMLGVYAADELAGSDGEAARRITDSNAPKPAAPSRAEVAKRIDDEQASDRGQQATNYDRSTGEVIDQETEEEIARRLDAEQDARDDGLDDDVDDIGDDEQNAGPTAAEPEPERQAEPEKPAETVVEQPATPAADPEAASIDWESWLGKLDRDLDAQPDPDKVNALYDSKAKRLASAPDGVKNRARGYRDARLRKLGTTAAAKEEPAKPPRQTAAQKREAAAAAAIDGGAESSDKPQTDGNAEAGPDPRTAKADEIIATFDKKEIMMDLRNYRNTVDGDIDAMDDVNARRVIDAYRAAEDRLGKRK